MFSLLLLFSSTRPETVETRPLISNSDKVKTWLEDQTSEINEEATNFSIETPAEIPIRKPASFFGHMTAYLSGMKKKYVIPAVVLTTGAAVAGITYWRLSSHSDDASPNPPACIPDQQSFWPIQHLADATGTLFSKLTSNQSFFTGLSGLIGAFTCTNFNATTTCVPATPVLQQMFYTAESIITHTVNHEELSRGIGDQGTLVCDISPARSQQKLGLFNCSYVPELSAATFANLQPGELCLGIERPMSNASSVRLFFYNMGKKIGTVFDLKNANRTILFKIPQDRGILTSRTKSRSILTTQNPTNLGSTTTTTEITHTQTSQPVTSHITTQWSTTSINPVSSLTSTTQVSTTSQPLDNQSDQIYWLAGESIETLYSATIGVFGHSSEITAFNQTIIDTTVNSQTISGLSIDYQNSKAYLIDSSLPGNVYVGDIVPTSKKLINVKTLMSSDHFGEQTIFIDSVNGKLYFHPLKSCNATNGYGIFVGDIDPKNPTEPTNPGCVQLSSGSLNFIPSFAIDGLNGKFYFMNAENVLQVGNIDPRLPTKGVTDILDVFPSSANFCSGGGGSGVCLITVDFLGSRIYVYGYSVGSVPTLQFSDINLTSPVTITQPDIRSIDINQVGLDLQNINPYVSQFCIVP